MLNVTLVFSVSLFSGIINVLFSDAPVNVGWGKKETQFHGSLGKEAAKIKSEVCLVHCRAQILSRQLL